MKNVKIKLSRWSKPINKEVENSLIASASANMDRDSKCCTLCALMKSKAVFLQKFLCELLRFSVEMYFYLSKC